jgi:hypothetical protein
MPNKFSFIAIKVIARYSVLMPGHWEYFMDSLVYYIKPENSLTHSHIYIFKNLLLYACKVTPKDKIFNFYLKYIENKS